MSNYDWKEIGPKMVGNWQNAIFALTGLNLRDYHPKKHYACPICGGKDRFRFDDRKPKARQADGSGGYFCNSCGSGDGMQLYQRVANLSFSQAVNELGKFVGGQPVEQRRAAVKAIESAPMMDYGKEMTQEEAADRLSRAVSHTMCPLTLIEGICPGSMLILFRKGAEGEGFNHADNWRWANPVNRINVDGSRGMLCNVSTTNIDGFSQFLAGDISYNAGTVIDGSATIVICERLVDAWHVYHQTGATVIVAYSPQNVDHIARVIGPRAAGIVARGDDIDTIIYAEENDLPVWAMRGKKCVGRVSAAKVLNRKEEANHD